MNDTYVFMDENISYIREAHALVDGNKDVEDYHREVKTALIQNYTAAELYSNPSIDVSTKPHKTVIELIQTFLKLIPTLGPFVSASFKVLAGYGMELYTQNQEKHIQKLLRISNIGCREQCTRLFQAIALGLTKEKSKTLELLKRQEAEVGKVERLLARIRGRSDPVTIAHTMGHADGTLAVEYLITNVEGVIQLQKQDDYDPRSTATRIVKDLLKKQDWQQPRTNEPRRMVNVIL
eukprot:TRINITY_DN869_c1_g3_i1.p1 TRINITY_DN869_c1_g3~~TRINITY_DN869_c1_g3_i1.p1  ORF type:complete len:236 (+),score=10.88 TRINITY_DN869_c1_g3_i1:145-852(+)